MRVGAPRLPTALAVLIFRRYSEDVATKRKNPALSSEIIPDFPLAHWIDRDTGESFNTVTVRLDDGRYLAVLAHDQEIRATGRTKELAERALLEVRSRRANPDADEEALQAAEEVEDEEAVRDYLSRKRSGQVEYIDWNDYKALHRHARKR